MATATDEQPATATPLGKMVPLSALQPSPLNPRKRFDDASMQDLVTNVQKHGVIVPLIVRQDRLNEFGEVIDGERRYRAAIAAGLSTVPVIFRDELTDGEVIEIQLLSAIQRQDLTPLEEAGGFKALIESNRSHYSVAYIADRIGRSEKWVWDRMKLLDLVPTAKLLLEAELMLVGHAEVLAKLKPEDQARAIGEVDYGSPGGGLFERAESRLGFDEGGDIDADDELDEVENSRDPLAQYRGLKARTVKELEAWISRHVRFDVQHAAEAAPLDFGAAALKVEEAAAQPGRGKKVVEITFEYQVPPDTRGDARMLTARAWKRADGSEGNPECEFKVLGVVAAGRQYGRTFDVCTAKDKCTVHWKDEIKAREKSQKLQAKGQGGQARQHEVVDEAKRKAEQEEADRRRAAWDALEPLIFVQVVEQAKKIKALTAAHAKALRGTDLWQADRQLREHLGPNWFKFPVASWVVLLATSTRCEDFDDYIKTVAKPLGFDIKKLVAVRDKHQPPPVAKKAATTKKGKRK